MSPLLGTRGSGSASAYGFTSSGTPARLESGVVTSGLVLSLDAKYPGTSRYTEWQDGSGNNRNFTWQATPTYNPTNSGTYNLEAGKGCYKLAPISNNTNCTFVFWMKTDDPQALFWSGTDLSDASGGFYLGAYNPGNVEYYGNLGTTTPQFLINTVDTPNIYDYTRTSVWRMFEFKNVDLTAWQNAKFNMYNTFTFDAGEVGAIFVYNRTLNSTESTQNFNALRGRYGL